jgi:hypothetical protein
LNERIQITNEDQTELITNLKNELATLKSKLEQAEKQAFVSDTRTPDNSDKDLYILKLKPTLKDGSENLADNQKFYPYKLCADSTNKVTEILRRHNAESVWHRWVFPGSMNVKQMLNKFNYKYYLNVTDLVPAVEYIRSLNPKEEH